MAVYGKTRQGSAGRFGIAMLGTALLVLCSTAQAGMVGSIDDVYYGMGNSADNFIVEIFDAGPTFGRIEIAIKAKQRFQGDLDTPVMTGPDQWEYTAATGNSPISGSDPTPAPGTTTWNFDWSVTFLDFSDEALATASYAAILGVDFKPNDPDPANRLFFDALDAPFTNISTDPTKLAFQGSQNIGFDFWQGLGDPNVMPVDPFAAGVYDLSLTLLEGTAEVAAVNASVNVVPEPGILALFGAGLLGLRLGRRRKS